MPCIYADLHSHTYASDGELSPEALVDCAAEAGVQVLAVTDHDTVAGVARAQARGKDRGVEVIPGSELTIYVGPTELHLLALFVDFTNGPLVTLLEKMQEHRRARGMQMVQKLKAAGINIEESDVLESAGSSAAIGRPHVAAALVKRGHAPSHHYAFLNFLQEGKPGFVSKFKLAPADAFAAIHASGGVAIMAHPGERPHDELITPLFREGMDGIEAHYRSHSEINRRFYAGLARRYEKVISGGSDFHGPRVRPGVNVGDGGVDRQIFGQLRNAAEFWKHKKN
jgi:predicted metal-dependent phosphoesterase TrpH